MIRYLVYLTALLYCFVWFRIPDIAGMNFPIQRLVIWTGLLILYFEFLYTRKIYIGYISKKYIFFTSIFMLNMLINFIWQLRFPEFEPIYFIMDFSKYLAAFTVAYLIYYALSKKIVDEGKFINFVIISGKLSIYITMLALILYLIGFRTDNDIFLRTFGNNWGVWPTDSFLPRLAGTVAEPQQLSIIFVTPILLLLALNKGKMKVIVLLALLTLLLSQSKFAFVSMFIILFYIFITNKKRRIVHIYLTLCLAPFAINYIHKLPTIARFLEQGSEAGAIQDRLENAIIMSRIIKEKLIFGIGAGQYGIYRSSILPVEYNPTYYPNNDYLKVFSELGLVGFIIVLWLFILLTYYSIKYYKNMVDDKKPIFLAICLGTITIALNMFIGYELLHVFFWINVGLLIYFIENYGINKSSEITKNAA